MGRTANREGRLASGLTRRQVRAFPPLLVPRRNGSPEYEHDFHLSADIPITGKIVDAEGKPVVGVDVSVVDIYGSDDPHWKSLDSAIAAGDPGRVPRDQIDPDLWSTPLYPGAWKMLPRGTTDSEGRFRITGVGRDRAVYLRVTGAQGLQKAGFSVLTRDDVAGFTKAARAKYPGLRLFGPSVTFEAPPGRTVAGVVKDADHGRASSPGMDLTYCTYPPNGLYLNARPRTQHGQYRIFRPDVEASVMVFTRGGVSRLLAHDAPGSTGADHPAQIVMDLDLRSARRDRLGPRVGETGTNRPIVSGPSAHSNEVGLDLIEDRLITLHYLLPATRTCWRRRAYFCRLPRGSTTGIFRPRSPPTAVSASQSRRGQASSSPSQSPDSRQAPSPDSPRPGRRRWDMQRLVCHMSSWRPGGRERRRSSRRPSQLQRPNQHHELRCLSCDRSAAGREVA